MCGIISGYEFIGKINFGKLTWLVKIGYSKLFFGKINETNFNCSRIYSKKQLFYIIFLLKYCRLKG